MLKKLFGTLAVAVLFCVGAVLADEIKGKVTKVDEDGNKVTLTKEDGSKVELTVSADTKYPGKGDKATLKNFAKAVERAGDKGVSVTVVTEKKDGKEVVKEIKREARRRTDKTAKPPQE